MKSYYIRKKRNVILGIALFACAIMSKGFVDALFVTDNANGVLNLLKYFFLIGASFAFYASNRNKKRLFSREFRTLMYFYLFVALISVFLIIWSGRFTFRTIKEFCFILTPIIFVYYAINALNKDEILSMAKFSVVIYVVSYFIEIADRFSVSMAINAIKNFSLLGGQASFAYDYYETSHFPDPMMALFCYFCYYKKNNRKWIWISYISILLMNKRLIILFATIILVLSYLPNWKKITSIKVNKKICMICVIIFAISPLVVIKLTTSVLGIWFSNKTGINMADFWMGRDNMVLYYLNHHFQSYGLGSTYDFSGFMLEIESVKIYLETTIVGSILLSISYWKITNCNFYSMLVMLYIFLNMNTSTSLTTGSFAWIYYLFLIGGINYETTYIGNSSGLQS